MSVGWRGPGTTTHDRPVQGRQEVKTLRDAVPTTTTTTSGATNVSAE